MGRVAGSAPGVQLAARPWTRFTVVYVHLAYVDESGNVGLRGTRTFSLACVLMPSADWLETFDRMISFRRWLRAQFGVPVPRDSRQSYFVQLADLAAYAAFRRYHPPPPRLVPIVPQRMWDELGPARYLEVTTRNKVGIVRYPP
jgi:Protein of unknown function (DUF3800)